MGRLTTFTAACFLAFTAHLNAAEPYEMPGDANAAETAAYAVLERHCARCHQEGKLKEGLKAPKSGFGHVLDIRRLASDTKFVIQGKPDASKLTHVLGEFAYPRMPDDCTPENTSCFPTEADAAVIYDWIATMGAGSGPREFVSLSDEYKAALADLLQQPTNRQSRIRYISMRVLHNDTEVTDENLHGYLTATIKLLNALSRNPKPYVFEAIEDNEYLMRVYLPDLDWDQHTWGLMEQEYTYGMTSEVDPSLRNLQALSETDIPIIRADWLAAHASQPPLYYDILRLPDTFSELERMLGIELRRNILNEQVIRAGFQNSGVSRNNRMIERHDTAAGFFWTSYDFAGSKGLQNFFEYPLGPRGVYPDELAFVHDGGETIFTLPNGFHAYYLNTADGQRIERGPVNIVRDDDYTDGTGEVINGISCISCHARGMRFNEDKVHDIAVGNLALSASARQQVAAVYPGNDVVQAALLGDQEKFFAALRSAGLEPDTEAGGLEPVRGLFVYHIDAVINFEQAANELGMRVEDLRAKAGFAGADMASLLQRLDQSPIKRDEWTTVFPILLERVTDYLPVNAEVAHADTAMSFSVRQAVGDHVPVDTYTHDAAASNNLTVYTDKPVYHLGDGIRIFVEPRVQCRLTIVNIDDDGDSCVLYPHPQLADDPIPAGTRFIYPPRGSITAAEAGTETILAICNASAEAVNYTRRDTSQVSCDPSQRANPTHRIQTKAVYETFVLNLDGPEQTTDSGASFKALSSHNREVLQGRIQVEVKP